MKYDSLITEIITLLLLVILVWNLNHKKRTFLSVAVKWFWGSLFMTAICIILNIICTILLAQGSVIPYALHWFLNTLYFIFIVVLSSMIAMYVFHRLLEHVYDNYCIKRAKVMLLILILGYICVVIANLKLGIIFWFDASGSYHRGPLNSLGYGVAIIEMALMYQCYFKHKASVSKEMTRAIQLFPPMMVFLIVLQILYPNLLLNEMMAVLAQLILFLSFHNQREGFDSITTLSNRDAFFSELRLRTAGNQQFEVFLMTLKDFREINNRYGYQVGNEFLYSVALWLEKSLQAASVFRYIGVTFAIIVPYEKQQSDIYRQTLLKRFEQDWKIGKYQERLQAVFGDFVYYGQEESADSILETLDYVLSTIKYSEQSWLTFDDTILTQFIKRKKIAQLIKDTIRNHGFEIWYQPVYCLQNEQFCSAEALIRMKNEKGEYVSAEEFIPIAEEFGMIDDIFWIVLEHVCEFLSRRQLTKLESISINLSMIQLEDLNFTQKVLETLKKYNLKQENITFEITERQFSDNSVIVQNTIRQMIESGFQFYLDDFGIGYSNFSVVTKYQFEFVKLDKTLINEVMTDYKSYLWVQNLITTFHDLGIKVIAEGVETKEQLTYLANQKTERIQGYYYAKIMNEEQLISFLYPQSQDI